MHILQLAASSQNFEDGKFSIDGSKIHADASKSNAVSYKRLVEMEGQLRQEVAGLIEAGEQADQKELHLPDRVGDSG